MGYGFSLTPQKRSSPDGGRRSAVARAAYRSCEKLVDLQTGEVHNYRRKQGLVDEALCLPGGREESRQEFWNRVDAHHKRADAITSRELLLKLPKELDREQRRELAIGYARELAEKYGIGVDACLHDAYEVSPEEEANGQVAFDDRGRRTNGNYHVHLMLTACTVSADGQLGKKQELLDPIHCQRRKIENFAEAERGTWCDRVNTALEAAGHDLRWDHRSLEDQGIERAPQPKKGPAVTAMERRGETSEVLERQRAEVAAQDAEIARLATERLAAVRAAYEALDRAEAEELLAQRRLASSKSEVSRIDRELDELTVGYGSLAAQVEQARRDQARARDEQLKRQREEFQRLEAEERARAEAAERNHNPTFRTALERADDAAKKSNLTLDRQLAKTDREMSRLLTERDRADGELARSRADVTRWNHVVSGWPTRHQVEQSAREIADSRRARDQVERAEAVVQAHNQLNAATAAWQGQPFWKRLGTPTGVNEARERLQQAERAQAEAEARPPEKTPQRGDYEIAQSLALSRHLENAPVQVRSLDEARERANVAQQFVRQAEETRDRAYLDVDARRKARLDQGKQQQQAPQPDQERELSQAQDRAAVPEENRRQGAEWRARLDEIQAEREEEERRRQRGQERDQGQDRTW